MTDEPDGDVTFRTDAVTGECPICKTGLPLGIGRDGRRVVICRRHGILYARMRIAEIWRFRVLDGFDRLLRWFWRLGDPDER